LLAIRPPSRSPAARHRSPHPARRVQGPVPGHRDERVGADLPEPAAAGLARPLLLHGEHPVPSGTLQERDSTSNFWQTIPYGIEGFGTDYLSADEPGGIQMLSPGGIATFEYRVSLSPATSAQVTRGTASIDVTLEALPRRAVIGRTPAAGAAIDIQSGQPPA
jgi:hypothetical protein